MEDRLEILLSAQEISVIVTRLAKELRLAYGFGEEPLVVGDKSPVGEGEPLVVISILNGAFVFTADLIRALALPVELDFMRLASYGRRDAPAQVVSILEDVTIDIKGRNVLIIEDIVDRGLTLMAARERLETKGPADIKVCSLLLRRSGAGGSSEEAASVDFVGKYLAEGFVVGYGMDFKERYRELPGLYTLPAEASATAPSVTAPSVTASPLGGDMNKDGGDCGS